MKYTFNQLSIAFEIPDRWLEDTGAMEFKPKLSAYTAFSIDEYPTEKVSFNILQAPVRNAGVPLFVEERMVSLIKGILSNEAIPPVEIHLKPGESKYRIKDGFHRYYISLALGFETLPISEKPYFDINEL